MDLKEICPKHAELKLPSMNKTYLLRPISIADEIWLTDRFGDKLDEVFNKGLIRDLAAIAFHQLEEKDKADFAAEDYNVMDDNGEMVSMRLGGEKLFFARIFGPSEKIEIYKALIKTLGISQPVVDGAEQKKSLTKKAAKKVLNDFGKRP